jgi:hypothetical protein
MRPAQLYEVANSRFDIYENLQLRFVLLSTLKKYWKIKYKTVFLFLRFSTVQNLHIKKEERVLQYMLWPKTQIWM